MYLGPRQVPKTITDETPQWFLKGKGQPMEMLADRDVLALLKAGRPKPIILWSPPGVGKSDTVRQVGKGRVGRDPRDIGLVLEPRHLPLGELPGADGDYFASRTFLAAAIEYGERLGIADRLPRGRGKLRKTFAQPPRLVE